MNKEIKKVNSLEEFIALKKGEVVEEMCSGKITPLIYEGTWGNEQSFIETKLYPGKTIIGYWYDPSFTQYEEGRIKQESAMSWLDKPGSKEYGLRLKLIQDTNKLMNGVSN